MKSPMEYESRSNFAAIVSFAIFLHAASLLMIRSSIVGAFVVQRYAIFLSYHCCVTRRCLPTILAGLSLHRDLS